MPKIGLFYGSTSGNTAEVSQMVVEEVKKTDSAQIEIFDIADAKVSDLKNYKYLVVACSTWYDGQLQDDWDSVVDELDQQDFSGIQVALIGLGDQYSYSSNYCDAMGTLAEKFKALGAKLVGSTEVDASYDFDDSTGVKDGKWVGLAIDQINQEDLTKERVAKWITQILKEFDVQDD